MRRTAASLLAVSLLLLAGCSSDGADDSASPSTSASASPDAAATASAEDVAALEAVTLTGEPGEEPTFDFEQPFSVSAAVARVVTPGTGETVEEGQLIGVNIAAVSGEDGSSQGGTYGSTPQSYVADDANLPPALLEQVLGQKVGARLLFANPSTTGTLLLAVEIMSTQSVPTRAEGTAVTPLPEGLPTVTLADDGRPSIEPVDGDAPTELVVQPLIEGSGPAVEEGQTLTVQYSGWLWDGTPFDSSWERGASSTFALTGVIEGWQQGLAGQPVGSQVLLVIPPDLGYGDQEQDGIPAGSTLVFVVDILAAS
ncbi:FKBP-type peptidyl-prolyl cis-trans isomerase [Cellulomonas sp. C5510]|uniref:FKBP-type peptidyl-prolyl cis-trans isomerase n=1 Tax=Cellulomonas sp. C5510 TaxID=2871170 RepID=UPI001C96B4F4|nr:FKBP-type peptidyl-prolyl cis-trans isomerase [Cellulomonas sp. C5510]QZN85780.1 FKBP-type peptidyl-prolyl cis-trans isomerase [Cellulomonas sp. C5510]